MGRVQRHDGQKIRLLVDFFCLIFIATTFIFINVYQNDRPGAY
jgi:hypothetical protein